ncbi:unnamed protein product [Anisakis simplex]|uniref:Uncharacterized protein n=1 Tax=Anisakis simplex TaxID=6269 RepID=A0A0M3J2V9_ANISI|nr:unnamed protein product [Anisakis simplex]
MEASFSEFTSSDGVNANRRGRRGRYSLVCFVHIILLNGIFIF